jgi:hypothetical protein
MELRNSATKVKILFFNNALGSIVSLGRGHGAALSGIGA